MHQLLNFQVARQNSPSTVRGLDDLLEKFPELMTEVMTDDHQVEVHQKQFEDSPTLGRRPSLDTEVYEGTTDDEDEGLLDPTLVHSTLSREDNSSVKDSDRPRAPTPSHIVDEHPLLRSYSERDLFSTSSPTSKMLHRSMSESSPRPRYSPSAPPPMPRKSNNFNNGYHSPALVSHLDAPLTPPALPDLPDPNQYPDPYPYHQRHHQHNGFTMTPPISLFSEGSSSASTRSSAAYASSRGGLRSSDAYENTSDDYHPRGTPTVPDRYSDMAGYDDDGDIDGDADISGEIEHLSHVGVASTSDDAVQLGHSASMSSFGSNPHHRGPPDINRWSGSSFVNEGSGLRNQTSYDWDAVDERDEYGITTDEETDLDDAEDGDADDIEADRTAAIVVAEEGRGLIVRGEGAAVDTLVVHPGATHMLLASSSTPNQMPAFLGQALSSIPHTLLALDISGNLLPALPPALAACEVLEELNIAANPLRALPVWLSHLTSLRVLIADNTGISAIPAALNVLTSLHTLSLRRNRLYSLPAWLCHLTGLETLLLDGNPFQGPWLSLVTPLLTPIPMTPAYPPNTPHTGANYSATEGLTPNTGMTESFDVHINYPNQSPSTDSRPSSTASSLRRSISSPQRPPRTPQHPRSMYSSPSSRPSSSAYSPISPPSTAEYQDSRRLRSGYTPSSARPANAASIVGSYLAALDPSLDRQSTVSEDEEERPAQTWSGSRPMRRMKSADELTRMTTMAPQRKPLEEPERVMPRRYESLPRGAGLNPPPRPRRDIPSEFWENEDPDSSEAPPRIHSRPASKMANTLSAEIPDDASRNAAANEKKKWGFLKKMSMGRMRSGSTTREPRPFPSRTVSSVTPSLSPPQRPLPPHSNSLPRATSLPTQTESRALPPSLPPVEFHTSIFQTTLSSPVSFVVEEEEEPVIPPPPPPKIIGIPVKQDNVSLLTVPSSTLAPPSPAASTTSLLTPTVASQGRAGRRRSFLPINFSQPPLEIPIPSPSPFVATVAVSDDADEQDDSFRVGSPAHDQLAQEEERHREAYTQALRSVMSYLRDMSDLSGPVLTADVTTSPGPGSPSSADDPTKRRRPTIGSDNRLYSEGSFASSASSSHGGQLHKKPSSTSLRGGALSVTTTDSGGSNQEERKYKEDKVKRAMVVKEIIETERTYVGQLQELVDIYVKPASAPVGVLANVGGKETMIPTAERKIVFNGLESLLSFHKESFLPALEKAHTLLKSQGDDSRGETSTAVASQIAQVFVSHAAFMRMYSTYINNFDNCVSRIKKWTEKSYAGTPGTSTPSMGSSHVVGLGLTMSAVAGIAPEMSTTSLVNLSSSQKKRIKSFLKRCRLSPRHSQLNLEGYLLLPVQRVPRYRLLLEELVRSTPPSKTNLSGPVDDPLEHALGVISSLATNMNEGKREAESRSKLVQWQSKISGKFPSPLVQPHRRLIMDGYLHLSRVVRKSASFIEIWKADGEKTLVQVECLAPELTPRPLVAILCNDLLVLCKDPSQGKDPNARVDLWAVLRMQTTAQPASVVHGSSLRLVDNKAILYFDAPSISEALTWSRAINLHIPASK